MSAVKKSYRTLKEDFLFEMDYISNIGSKMFICPFIGRSQRAIYLYYFTYSLILLTVTQLFIKLFSIGFSDWFEIINIAPNLGVCLMILVKYKKINDNRDLYDTIFKHFRDDLWDAVSDSMEHRRILNRYTQTTKLIVRFEFYYTIGLVIVVDLFPRIIMFYENNFLHKEKQYLYPFDGWYPFDKIKWFYAAYLWESFMTAVVILIFVFANILHISYTRYICMELRILGSTMEGLISDDDVRNIKKGKNVQNTQYKIKQRLKFVIKKHQFLAKITADLNNVLGDGMLLTYIFGSVFICLTAFTATVVDDLYKSVRYFSFFCSLLLEVFFQCIIGQLLTNHSEKLENAIYFAHWVYADESTKKMLFIFLIRAQTPFAFTAKGYLNMNLDTFSGICSLSYQFFNLLRTAYSE